MGSNLSRFLYPEESLQDQDISNSSIAMDGGVPWTPDPVDEAMDSLPRVTVMDDEHQLQTTERAASPPNNTESVEVNHLGDAINAKDSLCHQSVMGSTNDISKDVFNVHQLSENRMIETPQHVAEELSSSIDLKNVKQYYAPCDEAFGIANFYAQTSLEVDAKNVLENETPPSANKELSYSVESEEAPPFVVPGSEEIDQSLDFDHSESLQDSQVAPMIQDNSEMGKSIEIDLEGRKNSQVSVVNGNDMIDDIMFNEASTNSGREITEIDSRTASAGLAEGSILEAASNIHHQPNHCIELAQTDVDSPEETANVIMEEMLKSIFNNEDEVQRTSTEDGDNTIENTENNFVNVSQFTVTESIPLKFDLVTGEMVPDIEIQSDKVSVEQMSTFIKNVSISAPFQKPKEFISKEKAICSKNVAKVKPNSTCASRSISKVKPLPHNTPLELMTILSASATPSWVRRQCSSRKCSCSKHSVLGYPPSSVLYWQVRTTPGIRKTIMDFDNEGVKFLYDDGCLRAFETVLKSFKPEFLAAEKSLEVSLCLSCVRWAEGEVKDRKKSSDSEVDNKSHTSTEIPSTGVDNKPRKRGRPPIPGGSKKARKESTDGENVYKKKYSSRSRPTDFAHDQQISEENNQQTKEESKSPKMLMYDLYCDMPGCNARLRGYPSLIKHFKAKHPNEAVTPEETGTMDENGLCTEEDRKYITSINNPFLKLKAEEDMNLLYIKVEKLQDITLPSGICLADKGTESIKERRKSVGFKEGESLVTIREISPRRHYETRYRGNEKNEMVAITDLQSRNNNVQSLLSPENKYSNSKVPSIKTHTLKDDLKVDKNQNQINKFDMVPETLSSNNSSISDYKSELKKNVQSKSPPVENSTLSPMRTSRSARRIENEKSPSRHNMVRVDLVPVDVSPLRELELSSPELKKLSNINSKEEEIRSQTKIDNECIIKSSNEKTEAKNIGKVKTQLKSKSSAGPTSNSQSNPYISTDSDEVFSKRTRSSLSLGEEKSSQKTGLRRKGHDLEPDNNGSDAEVTSNDVKDLDGLFGDIEAGNLTIQLAAKNKGLKYAKMYHLYRSYKMDKLKSYCEKIKTSNKIKEKYGNRCKMPNSLKEGPAKKSENSSGETPIFNPDNVEYFQEAVNVAEPSQETVNISLKNLQDRTNGIRNVKRELKNHLSFAEPLRKDDKRCLLEVLGVINEALLKDP